MTLKALLTALFISLFLPIKVQAQIPTHNFFNGELGSGYGITVEFIEDVFSGFDGSNVTLHVFSGIPLITHLDSNNQRTWFYELPSNTSDVIGYQAPDSSYWIACKKLDSLVVRRIAPGGNVAMQNSYLWAGQSITPHSVVADSLGNAYILGHRTPAQETVLIKIDNNGNVPWVKSLNNPPISAAFTKNKLFITKGNHLIFSSQTHIFKADLNGSVLSSYPVPQLEGFAIGKNEDLYILTEDSVVCRFDQNDTLRWVKKFTTLDPVLLCADPYVDGVMILATQITNSIDFITGNPIPVSDYRLFTVIVGDSGDTSRAEYLPGRYMHYYDPLQYYEGQNGQFFLSVRDFLYSPLPPTLDEFTRFQLADPNSNKCGWVPSAISIFNNPPSYYLIDSGFTPSPLASPSIFSTGNIVPSGFILSLTCTSSDNYSLFSANLNQFMDSVEVSATVFPGYDYWWDWGDGTSDTLQNGHHLYDSCSSFVACFHVASQLSHDSICFNVTPYPGLPIANFTFSLVEDTAFFSDSSQNSTSIFWEFGQGDTSSLASPYAVYQACDTFDICMVAINQCGLDTTCQQLIAAPPSVGFSLSQDSICSGNLLFTSNQSGGQQWTWSLNGTPYSQGYDTAFVFIQAGTQTVQLLASNPFCSDSTQQAIAVFPVPSPDLPPDTTICPNDSIVIGPTAGNLCQYLWSNGNTSPYISVSNSGTYILEVVTCDGCLTSDTFHLSLDSVNSSFTFTTFGNTVFFNGNTTNAASWTWDFGDGAFLYNYLSPTHIYNVPGIYTVCLEVTSPNGCIHTTCDSVAIILQHLEDDPALNLLAFPNPFQEELEIRGLDGTERLVLLNSLGKIVFSSDDITAFDFSSLPPGIYYLGVFRAEGDQILRLVKQ